MDRDETFTLSWIADATGFDRRTIAFYVQEGLLPKIGRRGRSTRYTRAFLDRLLFIRRVRDLQDAGQLRAVTLSEIRGVLAHMLPDEIRQCAAEDVAPEQLRALFEDPDRDTRHLAVPAEDLAIASFDDAVSAMVDEPQERGRAVSTMRPSASGRRDRVALRFGAPLAERIAPGPGDSFGSDSGSGAGEAGSERESGRLQRLLRAIDRKARAASTASVASGREHVVRAPVTDELYVAVRNLREEDAELVEELAEVLRGEMEGE